MLDFMLRIATVTVELSRLLKMRFTPDRLASRNPLGKSIYAVFIEHNAGNLRGRELELMKLQLFALELQIVERYDPKMLNHFVRELKKAGTTDVFYGIRFEVTIAVRLINNGFHPLKTESPDFRVPTVCGEVAIECTSARVREPKDVDLAYKVRSALTAKSKKHYSNSRTALALDITNLVHNKWGTKLPMDENIRALTQQLNATLTKDDFGSILLFAYVHDGGTNIYTALCTRIDNMHIDSSLKSLLDTIHPFGKQVLTNYSVPREG